MEKHRPARHAIDPVAKDSAAESLACVRADLVRASRYRTKFDQSGAIAGSNAPPVRCCGKPMLVGHHPPARFGSRSLRQRHVDDTLFLGELRRDDRKIIFLDLSCLEQLLELRARLRGAGEEQATAG